MGERVSRESGFDYFSALNPTRSFAHFTRPEPH